MLKKVADLKIQVDNLCQVTQQDDAHRDFNLLCACFRKFAVETEGHDLMGPPRHEGLVCTAGTTRCLYVSVRNLCAQGLIIASCT